ncbi:hypothetical protein M758_N006900 [Ceratodon purpureus]|nr:hypothetical protein M758_N006900 [Ceratodon purpureus]
MITSAAHHTCGGGHWVDMSRRGVMILYTGMVTSFICEEPGHIVRIFSLFSCE